MGCDGAHISKSILLEGIQALIRHADSLSRTSNLPNVIEKSNGL